ncbi:MAG: acyl-CoA dehydrogenase C-terminal domain-containing protein, partial [Mycobacterium sp.]|nr:acyl-CoA dehydrogenase C-terminal domain-containing protein [Mycobacterium sp.]
SIYKVGLGSVRFLMSVGDLVMGWVLLRQASVAVAALDGGAAGGDAHFYEGKIAAASFFAKIFLPLLSGTRQVIDALDHEVMELDEAAF